MNRKKRKPKDYWSKGKCKEKISQFKYVRDFREKYPGAYVACKRNKWWDELGSDLLHSGNRFNKCIYAYEFPDNHVYIGLTYNIDERKENRKKDTYDQVTIRIKMTRLEPNIIQLTDYIPVEESRIKENYFIDKYRSEGWLILNKNNGGAIGCSEIKWTKEACAKEALKHIIKNDFAKAEYGAYQAAYKRDWLDEICSHMKTIKGPKPKWNKETCFIESLKYTTRSLFAKGSSGAYYASRKNNWLKEYYKP